MGEACLAFTVAFLLPSDLLLLPRPLNTLNHGHTMEERPGWEKAKQGSEGTFVWGQMIQEETSARSCICRRKQLLLMSDSGAGEEQSSLRSLGQAGGRHLLPASDTGAQKGASV